MIFCLHVLGFFGWLKFFSHLTAYCNEKPKQIRLAIESHTFPFQGQCYIDTQKYEKSCVPVLENVVICGSPSLLQAGWSLPQLPVHGFVEGNVNHLSVSQLQLQELLPALVPREHSLKQCPFHSALCITAASLVFHSAFHSLFPYEFHDCEI